MNLTELIRVRLLQRILVSMRKLFIRGVKIITTWFGLGSLLDDDDLLSCSLINKHLSLRLLVVEELPRVGIIIHSLILTILLTLS